MRARNIKPGFFENEELGECSYQARLLFIGLWCFADREGKFLWRIKKMKALIFPYDNVDIEKFLSELVEKNQIVKYDVDEKGYGYIPTFKNHQHPHPHEAKSVIPDPPENLQLNQCHGMSMTCNDMSCNVSDMSVKCQADIMILRYYDIMSSDTLSNLKDSQVLKIDQFVKMSCKELKSLIAKFGPDDTIHKLKRLNDYIGSTGRKYKSHYYTILAWENRNNKNDQAAQNEKTENQIHCIDCKKIISDHIAGRCAQCHKKYISRGRGDNGSVQQQSAMQF